MQSPLYTERESRFLIALRIIAPLTILFVTVFISGLIATLRDYVAVGLVAMFVIAVYFTYYMIDQWIRESTVDPVLKVYNAAALLDLVQRLIDRQRAASVMMIRIEQLEAYESMLEIDRSQEVYRTLVEHMEKLLFGEYRHGRPMLAKYRDDSLFVVMETPVESCADIARSILRRSQGWRYEETPLSLRIAVSTIEGYGSGYDLIVRMYKLAHMIKTGAERLIVEGESSSPAELAYDGVSRREDISAIALSAMPMVGLDGTVAVSVIPSLVTQQGQTLPRSRFWAMVQRRGEEGLFTLLAVRKILSLPWNTPVMVPVSDRLLTDEDFFRQAGALTRPIGERCPIVWEMTLSGLPQKELLEALDRWHAAGCRIALARFLPGVSMLRIATHPAIGWLLLERSVMDGIRDERTRALVGIVVAVAAHLDKMLVVTGVEHPSTEKLLHDLGVGICQGKLYGQQKIGNFHQNT